MVHSSVARGGGGVVRAPPPHWREKYAKYPVFIPLLRPIFALKTKIAPPRVLWEEVWWEEIWNLKWYGPEKLFLSLDEDLFFYETTWIWTEKPFQFRWSPFFWRSPKFGLKNRLNLSEVQWKSGSRSFDVVPPQKQPPPMQIPGYAIDGTSKLLGLKSQSKTFNETSSVAL